MILICLECGCDMKEFAQDEFICPRCGFGAEQLKINFLKGDKRGMRHLTHEECMSLLDSITGSPDEDWTHDLTEISYGPARFVERVILPSGLEVVYFKSPNGGRAWPAPNWDRLAVARTPQLIEQLTLF